MNNTTKKTTYILFSLLVSLILNGCWQGNNPAEYPGALKMYNTKRSLVEIPHYPSTCPTPLKRSKLKTIVYILFMFTFTVVPGWVEQGI